MVFVHVDGDVVNGMAAYQRGYSEDPICQINVSEERKVYSEDLHSVTSSTCMTPLI
jgi:hypothetical protein